MPDKQHSYELSRPNLLDETVASTPVAYIPIGCVEYHGPHLPVGVDMLTADAICHRAAVLTGGMVLPPLWLAAGVLPLPYGITMPLDVVRSVARSVLGQLAGAGFRVLVIVSGHGALDHLHVLREETEKVMKEFPDVRAITTMWNELNSDLDGDIHDHGAKVETSFMMEFQPDLVDLTTLADDPQAKYTGIYAANPRQTATRGWGATMADHAIAKLETMVKGMMDGEPADSWSLFANLVERLQSGNLEVAGARRSAGGLTIDFHNPHSQSKYITAVPDVSIDGESLDLGEAALSNPSPGEGHTDTAVSALGPLSGFYVRTGQTMRLTVPRAQIGSGGHEIKASFRLADVIDIAAGGRCFIGGDN